MLHQGTSLLRWEAVDGLGRSDGQPKGASHCKSAAAVPWVTLAYRAPLEESTRQSFTIGNLRLICMCADPFVCV